MQREVIGRKKKGFLNFGAFFMALQRGMAGYALFFTILVFTKILAYLLGTAPEFKIMLQDAFFSLIGFAVMFLIGILEGFKQE